MDYLKNIIEINKELRYKVLSSTKSKEDIGDVIFHLYYGQTPVEMTYYDSNILVISNKDLEIRINTQSGQVYYKSKNDRQQK